MRNPLGDGADQRRTRRRGKNADQSDRGDSGPADAGRTGGRSDRGRASHDSEPGRAGSDSEPGRAGEPRRTGRTDGGRGGGNDATDRGVTGGPGNRAGRVPSAGSLFAPGYGASPPESPDRGGAGGRTTGASAWYGSAAGGAAGGARFAGMRQFRVSRRRCTRPASSPPGIEGQAGPPPSQGRTGRAPGFQDCRETAAQLRTAARLPEVRPAIRASCRRPGRQGPQTTNWLSRGTTLRISAPVPSPVTRCWPSATRPRT